MGNVLNKWKMLNRSQMSGNVTNATVKSQTCELEDSRSNSKENRNQWKILKKNKSTNSERQINNNHNHHHHHHQRHHQFLHRHHHDVAAIIPKINENPKAECETLRTRAIVRIHQPPNLLTVAFGWYFLWAFLLSVHSRGNLEKSILTPLQLQGISLGYFRWQSSV